MDREILKGELVDKKELTDNELEKYKRLIQDNFILFVPLYLTINYRTSLNQYDIIVKPFNSDTFEVIYELRMNDINYGMQGKKLHIMYIDKYWLDNLK